MRILLASPLRAVEIKRLIISNRGNPGSENTGAIYSFGPLTLTDCILTGNATGGFGGAIDINGASRTLNR